MLSFRFLLSSVFFHTSHSLVVLFRSSSVSKQSLFVSFLNIFKKWFNLSIEDNPSQPKPIIQLQVQKFFIAHHICMCCACKIEKQTNKIVGQFHLVKWCSVWRVWCMKTSFSSPQTHTRTAPVYGGHLLRRDFFMWTSYSFIGCREKCCVYHWVRFLFCDELRVGVAGLRREKQHGHGVVNRWILTSVWGSGVSGGASCHWRYEPSQKCVCVYFFFLLPFYLHTHIHCTGNVRRIKPWPLAAFWK